MKQKIGIDVIGGVNYLPLIKKHWPKGFYGGALSKATGWKNGIKVVKALARTGDCPGVRLSGIWHDNHEFDNDDIEPALKQLRKLIRVKKKYPWFKCWYQPWLEARADEDDLEDVAWECQQLVKQHDVRIKIVSAVYVPVRRVWNEVHHNPPKPSPYIFSMDGKTLKSSNKSYWTRTHKDARIWFGWMANHNGKKFDTDPTPRWQRTNWPTKETFQWYKKNFKV